MNYKERQKAKDAAIKAGKNHYEGTCTRCKCKSIHIFIEQDLCFGCEQDELEFEEKRNAPPYDLNDREATFRHEKSQQGWSDDRDEEIWNEHFRF